MKLRSTLAALAAVVVMTGCGAKTPAPAPPSESPNGVPTDTASISPSPTQRSEVPASLAELKPEHVGYVTVIPPIPAGTQVPRPLYGARPQDRAALEQLLRGLAAAKPVDPVGAGAEHRRVEWLDIHLTNGRRIMVRQAWICRTEGNGTGCTTVPGKLVIAEGDQRTVVEAPELESFLGEGRSGAMPPVDRMTITPEALVAGEKATIKGDGWAGAGTYRLTLEGAGTEITLAEGVTTFGDFAWTGRVPVELAAGQYMLQLRLDTGAGVGYPVELVSPPASRTEAGAAVAPAWVPDADGIAWAQVRFGLPSRDASTPLYLGRPADVPALTRIVQWLRDAQPAQGEISTPSRDDYLHIRFRGGRTMTARLAHDCVTEKLAESTRMTCTRAEGQVIVHPPGGAPVRLRAPELAAWLRGGWRTDAPTAPAVEVIPLPGGRFRIQGSGWPEAGLMNIWLDGEGPGTCCPPSNGTRLAGVPVILGRFTWEGDIPGSGPFSLTVVADSGGARGVPVDR
ncbi:MAG TPA: hypothetical protein VD969_05160 [Symbiobacteriaceae bacterium]|nr:hypothetical protein [Symbiobacteriaceae bacterium]